MAEPLKNSYGPDIPRKIAAMINSVTATFPAERFIKESLQGYDALELMDRGRHMARALALCLPPDFRKASKMLIDSMGPKLASTESFGMTPFLYMPYAFYIAEHGLHFWDEAMQAQYELTQRFTAEFCIRPFLIHHQEKTLGLLKKWTFDSSPHVRRLVSEGTRPRLPWAMRLPAFQKDPRPVLVLLEILKDDPELYVRRSVANNLNDIGKDNPSSLFETVRKWMPSADQKRQWLIEHALRSAVKAGAPQALKILGFNKAAVFKLTKPAIVKNKTKGRPSVLIAFSLENTSPRPARFLVDFRIHYRKSNGSTSPKVFKLTELALKSGEAVNLKKRVSLENMTTRKHYPGRHDVEALVNGQYIHIGYFVLGK